MHRLMKMAEQFELPIITFVDTSGAYPGIEGEEIRLRHRRLGKLLAHVISILPQKERGSDETSRC